MDKKEINISNEFSHKTKNNVIRLFKNLIKKI